MSRNGSGVYSLPAGNPVVTGTTIASTWANNTMSDIASALTDSVAADGQTPMTGNLDLNSNKIVNLAVGTVAGNSVEYTQATSNVAITGGAINGTPVGASTASTGRFTTLDATGNTALAGTLSVTGTSTFTGLGSFNGTGALKIPVGTTAEQPTPATGQIRFNSSNTQFEGYNGSAWGSLGGGATGGGANQVFFQNDQTVTVNYTIPATKNAMSAGPITIDTGVTVTVSTGAVWTIV
jgi:hypothetical protein